ncbi:uncharacterized protein EDB93DRAFT_1176486, partial [Suillus bovinus]|uniref:uncharacterized protein n=1 Tax=Suillus bovinus TaxID=48563 RepID=UPI001B8854B0
SPSFRLLSIHLLSPSISCTFHSFVVVFQSWDILKGCCLYNSSPSFRLPPIHLLSPSILISCTVHSFVVVFQS